MSARRAHATPGGSTGAAAPSGHGGGPERAGPAEPAAPIVLFRCQLPTNLLCPCGAVARRLKRRRIPHRVERVAQRRSQRPEIEELTGQGRVPVLVDGDEVISDSRRILEYLDWRRGA